MSERSGQLSLPDSELHDLPLCFFGQKSQNQWDLTLSKRFTQTQSNGMQIELSACIPFRLQVVWSNMSRSPYGILSWTTLKLFLDKTSRI